MTINIRAELGTTQNLRGLQLAEHNFRLTAAPVTEIVSPGSTAVVTNKDSVTTVHTDATINQLFNITTDDIVTNTLDWPLQIMALDPLTGGPSNLATLSADGRLSYSGHGNGTVRVLAKTQWLARSLDLLVQQIAGASSTAWNSFVAGSAGKDAYDTVQAGLAGKSPGALSQAIWLPYNNDSGSYAWNTQTFLPGIDLTCVSPWNSDQGHQKAGTLISRRHVVFATHYAIAIGSRLHFVTSDNQVFEAVMVGAANYNGTDITIGCLDQDAPLSITPARIMPAGTTFSNKFPCVGNGYFSVPLVATNQDKYLVLAAINSLTATDWQLTTPLPTEWSPYGKTARAGDSGSPVFLVLNGRAALVGCFHTVGAGDALGGAYNAGINTIMATLSTANGLTTGETTNGQPYSTTLLDVSGYPTY